MHRSGNILLLSLVISFCSSLACFAIPPPRAETLQTPGGKPRLIVIVVVDQMRPDYLTRFDTFYTGGFRHLLDSGAVFLNAYHDHANTETAVGHATIATGVVPAKHGIIGNEFWERNLQRWVYAVEDSTVSILGDTAAEGASAKWILTPTLGDQLKQVSPASMAYAISGKDRSAIGMAGRDADGVFWYSRRNGNFVTSTAYDSVLPVWVDSFNTARQVDSYFAKGWEKLLPEESYSISGNDANAYENGVISGETFPHLFAAKSPSPDKRYYNALYYSPFGAELELDLAKVAIEYAALGQDTAADLLWVSISGSDAAGHLYGPNSHEIQDFYLRLDRYLDEFIAFLDIEVGRENYAFVLASDHGVMQVPEYLREQGLDAGRVQPDTIEAQIRAIGLRMQDDPYFFPTTPIKSVGSEIVLDSTAKVQRTAMSIPEFEQIVADAITGLPFIEDIYRRFELSRQMPDFRPHWQQYKNCYHEDRGPDLFIRFQEGHIVTSDSTGTTHGSPYKYDAQVPLIFMGPEIIRGNYADSVRTVDILPMLAALLRITPASPDGRVLKQALDL